MTPIGIQDGAIIVSYLGFERLKELGYSGSVNGPCTSSCTLVFMLGDVCAGPKAFFEFHAGSSELTKEMLWRAYPQKLRDWITARGGLTDRIIVATWPAIGQFMRRCE